jgi:hypothetical protein
MNDNPIIDRRITIANYLCDFFPKDISNLISGYDYHLKGKSNILIDRDNIDVHHGAIDCISVLSDGQKCRLVTGASDGKIKIWDPNTKKCDTTLIGHTGRITCIDIFHDESVFYIISGSNDKTIKIWNVQTGKCEFTFTEHDDCIQHIKVLSDGPLCKIVSGTDSSILKIWNPSEFLRQTHTDNSAMNLRTHRPGTSSRSSGVFSSDCGHTDFLSCINVLHDGRIVTGSHDNTLRIWNPKNDKCDITLVGYHASDITFREHTDMICSVSVLHDKRIISGAWDQTLKIWNAQTGISDITLKGNYYSQYITLLPDGRIISGSYDNILNIWDLETKKCISFENKLAILCCAIFPDGRIVTGHYDGIIKIWC